MACSVAGPSSGRDQVHQSQSIRAEELQRGTGKVADDRSVPGPGWPGRRVVRDGLEPVSGELGEECVEVAEVPVQHAVGDYGLAGDGPGAHARRAGAAQ